MTELVFFWVLFAVAGVLAYFIFAPYVATLFMGLVLAIVLQRPYQYVLSRLDGRTTLAALTTTLLTFVLVLIPVFLISSLLAGEVVSAYNLLTQSGSGTLSSITHWVNSLIQPIVGTSFEINLTSLVEVVLQFISANVNGLFMGVASMLFDAMLMLVALFFFLRDGGKLKKFAEDWSPLPVGCDEDILDKMSNAVTTVVKGTLAVAVVQGALTGIGLMLFGVPGALLWGVVATFVAILPMFGTALIFVPAALFLLFSGSIFAGIGMLLWGVVLVSNIDNVLRSIFLKKKLGLHPLIVFLSVLGGLAFFGPVGFIAGPVVVSLFFVLLELYPKLIHGKEIT